MWEDGVYKATPEMLAQDQQYWKQFQANGGQTALNQGYSVGADGKVGMGNQYNQGLATRGNGLNGLSTGLQGIQALSGLASAYTGLKGLGLAKDQFAFTKDSANRDVANQAKLINESRMNAGNVGLALAGGTMTDAQKALARDKIIAGNVDGSRIG